jgi:hypothetical protein
MRITSLTVKMVRADTTVAQFLVRLTLDGPVANCTLRGTVVGPRCPGITTVEIAYPLVLVETKETTATLKGVIPEPNLWTQEAPFVYELTVHVWLGDRKTDTRTSILALRDR